VKLLFTGSAVDFILWGLEGVPLSSIDTDKLFVICTNILGGCYGSTGPYSIDPADGNRYATRFPILSLNDDMVRTQHRLVTEHLGISNLYAAVGSSMGGMQLAFATEFPDDDGKVISISCYYFTEYSTRSISQGPFSSATSSRL
jgi:homoserine acetyltransferase